MKGAHERGDGAGERQGSSVNASGDPFASARQAAEGSPLPIALTEGPEHRVRYANPTFGAAAGQAPAALLGEPLPSLVGGRTLAELLDRVAAGAVTDRCPEVSGPAAGALRAATAIAWPLLSASGEVRGLKVLLVEAAPQVPMGADAQDLREANQRLIVAGLREQELAERAKRSADEMAALLESMAEGVTVFGPSGDVLLMNEVARQTFGFGPEPTVDDFARCDIRQLDGEPLNFERDVLQRILGGPSFTDEEVLLRPPDGEPRRLMLSGSAVHGPGGVALGISVTRDVTELRDLEQLREQYVSLITHDLRGPLSAAHMAGQLLVRDPDRSDRLHLAGRLLESLSRADRMVRNLLDAQRIRAGRHLPLELAECDLVEVARGVIEDLGTIHGDRFLLRGEPSLRGVWSCDELTRALWNLASNAVKYGSATTPVLIRIERVEVGAAVSVHNEGPPIPPEQLERLFTPYARSGQSGGPRGWGLGLTLVRGCARAHGGSVSVKSDAESGTTFRLELPLDARPQVEADVTQ